MHQRVSTTVLCSALALALGSSGDAGADEMTSDAPTPTSQKTASETAPPARVLAEIRHGRVSIELDDGVAATVPYRLVVPAERILSRHPNGLPLIVFLHGSGERGDDNQAQLRHFVGDSGGDAFQRRQPCLVLAVQCPADQYWTRLERDRIGDAAYAPRFDRTTPAMEAVITAIDEVLEGHPEVDRDRVHLTGLSIGGYGAFDLAARRPELFASVVPICGGGDPTTADRLAALPITIVHGTLDQVVPVEASRRMHAAIVAAQVARSIDESGRARLVEYPDAHHESWTRAYRFGGEGVLDWMFAQRRASPPRNLPKESAPR